MLVRFRTNLGSIDAKEYGVPDFTKCVHDAEVDLPDEAAEKVLARGFAVKVETVKAIDPPKVKGQSKKPSITAPVK